MTQHDDDAASMHRNFPNNNYNHDVFLEVHI